VEHQPARLAVDDVTLRLPGGESLLKILQLQAVPGEWIALRGPSGCGKSTLLEIIAGLRAPAGGGSARRGERGGLDWQGNLTANGVPLSHDDRPATRLQAYRRGIAWLPQRPVLEPGTVAETFRILARFRNSGITSADRAVVEAAPLLEELDLPRDVLNQSSATLSGGEMTRVALARIILLRRPVVLLDEPGAALDRERSRSAAAVLRRQLPDSTVLLVGHDDRWDVPDIRNVEVGR
jgi:ABC-type transport system involved in cytochrome bd biosynthesis fused ATPase/permease subunit